MMRGDLELVARVGASEDFAAARGRHQWFTKALVDEHTEAHHDQQTQASE
jgi:hypothetical protein